MKSDIAVGIDIGTYQIKVVIAEASPQYPAMPKVLGVGVSESKGLRHGYVTNHGDALKSVRKAIKQAENTSGLQVRRCYISVGGIGLESVSSVGSIAISRADLEITDLDIDKVMEECQLQIPHSMLLNKRIIHQIPLSYKIDGKPVLGNPLGMKGTKLELKALFVTYLEHHFNDIVQLIEEAGVDVVDVMAAPLAAGLVTLTKTEKIAGTVLANIGSETVSIAVYEDDIPISLEVFPIGSNDITKDIALGFQVSLEDAEKMKRMKEEGYDTGNSKKKLEEIVSARLSDIFELIDAHLKKIGKNGLLPGGIIITGGGSGIATIEDFAKANLKIPSRLGSLICDPEDKRCEIEHAVKIKDSTWSVAYGLTVFGLHAEGGDTINSDSVIRMFKSLFYKALIWFKQFLP